MILGTTRRGAVEVQLYACTHSCEGKWPQTMNRPHDAGPSVIPVPSFSHSARTRLRSSANLVPGSPLHWESNIEGLDQEPHPHTHTMEL